MLITHRFHLDGGAKIFIKKFKFEELNIEISRKEFDIYFTYIKNYINYI